LSANTKIREREEKEKKVVAPNQRPIDYIHCPCIKELPRRFECHPRSWHLATKECCMYLIANETTSELQKKAKLKRQKTTLKILFYSCFQRQ